MKIEIKAAVSQMNIEKWIKKNKYYDPMEFYLLIEDIDYILNNIEYYEGFEEYFGEPLDDVKKELEDEIINMVKETKSKTIYVDISGDYHDGELLEVIKLPKKWKKKWNIKLKHISKTKMVERSILICENNKEKETEEKRSKRIEMERRFRLER